MEASKRMRGGTEAMTSTNRTGTRKGNPGDLNSSGVPLPPFNGDIYSYTKNSTIQFHHINIKENNQ
jgi:hypothetical protein